MQQPGAKHGMGTQILKGGASSGVARGVPGGPGPRAAPSGGRHFVDKNEILIGV